MHLQHLQSDGGLEMSEHPILYSFRRCPYAMRARMSIVRTEYYVEHREVVLRERPQHMMEISPKGTVPVLQLTDQSVIEESLEIMQHVLEWELSEVEVIGSQGMITNSNIILTDISTLIDMIMSIVFNIVKKHRLILMI